MASDQVRPPQLEAEQAPSVRLIRGLRASAERQRGKLALLAAVVAVLWWLASGVYIVETGRSAALLQFGRLVDDAVAPGLHLRLPSIHRVIQAETAQVSRLGVEGDFVPELAMVTADTNLIEATLVVQVRISRLGDYLFAVEDPEELVRQVARAALVEAFAATPVDEVLTSAKAAVQNQVREEAQARLDTFGSGLSIVAVNLQSVNPPRDAADAFRAVSDARAEAAQKISQAEAERGGSLRLARGEAGQTLSEAQAAAAGRKQEARGSAERFLALLQQYRQAPDQTRTELYHATLQEVLPRARLVLLAGGETPRIDLNLIRRQEASIPSVFPVDEQP